MQFYGPEEIVTQVEVDGVVTLTLKSSESATGEQYEMVVPKSVFEMVVTGEKKDWNYVHGLKLTAASKEVIEVLMKHNITGGEVKTLLQKVGLDYFIILDRAINYQFTGNDKRFVPGGDVYYDFTLARAHEITKHLDGNTDTTTESAA